MYYTNIKDSRKSKAPRYLVTENASIMVRQSNQWSQSNDLGYGKFKTVPLSEFYLTHLFIKLKTKSKTKLLSTFIKKIETKDYVKECFC